MAWTPGMSSTRLRVSWRTAAFVCVLLALGLMMTRSLSLVEAQAGPGLGVGRGHGLEVGVNLDALNRIKADIAAGLYDRPCTPQEHDPTKWHTLVNIEARCHYDHQHNDDPSYVNDIFGEPGAWFGYPGQSVSYPWQTFPAQAAYEPNTAYLGTGKMENEAKHEGYIWVVRRDQQCPNGNCVTDFRLQTHAIMGAHDMPVRYHSFSLEARVCIDARNPSSCGIVRYGGWADMGRLFTTRPNDIDCGHAVQDIPIPLPADNLFFPLDRPDARDEIRCHPNIVDLPAYPSNRPLAEWWGHAGGETRFQLRSYDPIGNVNASDPAKWHFFCDQNDLNCRYDASIFSVFIGYTLHIHGSVGQDADGRWIPVDSNGDGRTDFRGYFDRWGGYNPSCASTSLDCIPYEYNNVVLNFFNNKEARYNQTVCENCPRVDYDLSPAGQKWITWFYTKYAGGDHGGTPPTQTPPLPPATETPVPPTPTDPTPTPEPPSGPAVRVDVVPSEGSPGDTVEVSLNLFNVSNLYGLQAQCQTDPAVLGGTHNQEAEGFNATNSLFVDKGFNPADGTWLVAATRLQPNPAISGNVTAFKLMYEVLGAGVSAVNCAVIGVDSDGHDLALTVINGAFNTLPVEPPPATETPAPPPATETPMPPTTTPEPPQVAAITGRATYQNRPDNAGIIVQLRDANRTVIAELVTNADGGFSFTDVPAGEYTVKFTGPYHLGSVQPVSMSGLGVDLGVIKLLAGDTNGDSVVDLTDAGLVGANFGVPVPPAPDSANLNGDEMVDIRDLALVGGNFDKVGPTLAD